MFARFCSGILLILITLPGAQAQAQFEGPVKLPVGNGFGQIGVEAQPNEECRGPATVTPAPNGRLAILDGINQKILVAGGGAIEEIKLPADLLDPVDLISTTKGYLVVGALGEVIMVTPTGEISTRLLTHYNPELGSPRIVALPSGQLALENLKGEKTPIEITQPLMGSVSDPGIVIAASFKEKTSEPQKAVFSSLNDSIDIKEITITSTLRIVDARTLWASENDGAIVAMQESRKLPDEASFVRLLTINDEGKPTTESYLGPNSFGCNIRRPFARLTSGAIVSLSFDTDKYITIDTVHFKPIGTTSPQALLISPDIGLIATEQDIFKKLEALNGTTNISLIALNQVSRESILEKAKMALGFKWYMHSKNYSHAGVPSKCSPPVNVWRRPSRLDNLLEKQASGIPYRWGGYAKSLDVIKKHLEDGKLAGSDCTCRKENCVYPNSTGLDCSGFVSYAWQTGNYFTTSSLPRTTVSTSIKWANLAPGDIVNKAGSHVRLVESVSDDGPNGPYVTVIESAANASCGGVCRRSYLVSELKNQGYKPLKRLNLTN